MAALKRGTIEEKVAMLREFGILDENGDLSRTYRDWGSKVSRADPSVYLDVPERGRDRK
jgi:hypothetical protein